MCERARVRDLQLITTGLSLKSGRAVGRDPMAKTSLQPGSTEHLPIADLRIPFPVNQPLDHASQAADAIAFTVALGKRRLIA